MVLTNPPQEDQSHAQMLSPLEGFTNTSHFPLLPPGLATLRPHFAPFDCSRKARVEKDHCVRFAQPTPLDILPVHMPLPALLSISTLPAGVGEGQPEKSRAGHEGLVFPGLKFVTERKQHGALGGLGRCVGSYKGNEWAGPWELCPIRMCMGCGSLLLSKKMQKGSGECWEGIPSVFLPLGLCPLIIFLVGPPFQAL
jgi:hypothetical protein